MSDNTKTLLPSEADTWLAEHPDVNRGELEEVWKLSELADIPFDPDEERIAEMREAIRSRMTNEKRTGLRFIKSQKWLNIAASVALVAGFGAALWLRPIVETAPAGTMASVVLPDGSTIRLNSGSTIEYRRTFGWMKRAVTLDGEAFFDVSKSQTEFDVSTFNGNVTVLGTRFNIRAWSDDLDPATTVHVDEGYVRVSAEAVPDSSVILEAGQWSTIKGGSCTVRALDDIQPCATGMAERRDGHKQPVALRRCGRNRAPLQCRSSGSTRFHAG